jgi:PadR family transcriptional regulator PadR
VHINRVRRKPGTLVPFEIAICVAAARLHAGGIATIHGYLLAKELKDETGGAPGYGTLYRALGRLEQMGMLTSVWEDPHAAAQENRPRRRFYSITDAGLKIAADARRAARAARRASARLARA